MLEFKAYPKTPRLENLHVRITQKLDGTNGVIAIGRDYWHHPDCTNYCNDKNLCGVEFKVGSRNGWLPSPEEIKQRDKDIEEWKKVKKAIIDRAPNDVDIKQLLSERPEKLHDNHGFSKWAYENKEALIEFLGEGYHYGEWCGPGIQNGEGLKEKGFYLFSPKNRYLDKKFSVNENYITIKRANEIGLHFVPELYNGKLMGNATDFGSLVNECEVKLKFEGSLIGDKSVKPEGLIVEIEGKFKFKVRF